MLMMMMMMMAIIMSRERYTRASLIKLIKFDFI
jgi:hypothetical protein